MARKLRLLKPRRQIATDLPSPLEPQRTPHAETVEKSHARQIHNLPAHQRKVVIESIVSGVKNHEISSFFAEQGWLTVTEKTFGQYLTAFKRVYPELLEGDDEDSLDGVVDPRKPRLDEEVVLEQLIRVNSRRLRKGVDFELSTGLVNKDLHKDIGEQRNLVEALAGLRGKGKQVGRPSQNAQPMSNTAQEQLRKAEIAEGSQERLGNLVGQLLPLLERKNVEAST